MIITYDIEDYKKDEKTGEYEPILDATGEYFIVGVIYKQTGGKKIFYKKEDMWQYILKLGESEFKRKKKLTCYGHNAKFDFYQIANLHDKRLRWFSEDPFIAGIYKETEDGSKKEMIKFLDTMSIFKMSLKDIGNTIRFPKLELPTNVGKKLTKEKLKEIAKYCTNDCKVTMKAIEFLKKKLKDDKVTVKTICTINQIAISYVINKLKQGNNRHILKTSKYGNITEFTWKPKYPKEIHSAYRGGYVRVWKTGKINNVTNIDFNSLYPYSATKISFPDLRTERKLRKPLENSDANTLLENIGISRVLIKNKTNKLGLLLVRTGCRSYAPKENKYIIGTWTHIELKEAIKEGYEIIDVEWSIIWDEGENPLKEIYNSLYEKRVKEEDEFNKYFYKQILNGSIGKFAQTKLDQEIVIDSIEKVYEYVNKNYEILKGIEGSTDIMFVSKDNEIKTWKKYYAPIIPTLITAEARKIMYNNYKLVDTKDLCYSDTDSIVFTGDYLNKFNIGTNMGLFKVEKDVITKEPLINTNAIIWGTKAKSIGNNIGVSAVSKKDLSMDEFKEGIVKSKKMVGIRSKGQEKIGKFIIEERNLKKQEKEYWQGEEEMNKQMLYIDEDIKDITYFANKIKDLVCDIENKQRKT